MATLANIVWLLFGGLETAFAWAVVGIVFDLTIIGIPLGNQCFKFAKLTLMPFGTSVEYGGGAFSLLANIVWLIVGIPAAICYLGLALCYAVTIIGIPIAVWCMKMAKLSLMPFGAKVE